MNVQQALTTETWRQPEDAFDLLFPMDAKKALEYFHILIFQKLIVFLSRNAKASFIYSRCFERSSSHHRMFMFRAMIGHHILYYCTLFVGVSLILNVYIERYLLFYDLQYPILPYNFLWNCEERKQQA